MLFINVSTSPTKSYTHLAEGYWASVEEESMAVTLLDAVSFNARLSYTHFAEGTYSSVDSASMEVTISTEEPPPSMSLYATDIFAQMTRIGRTFV